MFRSHVHASTDSETKHAHSTAKLKLFLFDGFKLDEKSAHYRDEVLLTGILAEKNILEFLQQHSISARGTQNVVKTMRKCTSPVFQTSPFVSTNITNVKPTKDTITPTKEFKTLCIAVANTCKTRVNDKAIRHLRLTKNSTVASNSLLPEATNVAFKSLTERTTSKNS
ncbi:Hypothetical protein PHPALM_36366 [Phytophthora palmivora]|uniref:Uncharacterized protein n=1 Tax=Phytophthora palmivora TaxID=4796 RepID=A0A2P4X037_9STRA|nr:Hypothetical protein PHPALM_36366 [Phytophthora palmivora]